MRLPFTEEQFLGVFARYNEAIWPMQIVAYVLAVAAVALAVRPRVWASRIVAVVLALMWLWTGWEYHIVYFAPINPAAKAFGALFILEGLAFLATAAARPLTFGVRADLFGVVGGAMILYAMVIYPMLGA
ncbi:MAG: DUF6064 family protein, partial [Armatimonadota bacterium]|nr:DUF6064 family protein [Armatimonadota bacterium]